MSEPASTTTQAEPMKTQPPSDISSILAQVQALQSDKDRLMKELSHLKQGKREEMKKVWDTVISKWLEDSVQDEDAKKQFTEGMTRIMDTTKENGIWTVACAASNLHKSHLEEIERLRTEVNTLKTGAAGSFRDDASRKRGREEPVQENPNDFWAGFELDMGRVQ
jgi:hypothetical protein